ncbi:zinc transporter 1 [Quercus suber]|uniref:Zinc transporter 1 n=1 Tax=Quercus suber TaxID=58331 RepID=A0AAW0K012_QUESU
MTGLQASDAMGKSLANGVVYEDSRRMVENLPFRAFQEREPEDCGWRRRVGLEEKKCRRFEVVDLTSPCLYQNTWGIFPFTGFFAMLSSIGTLMVDAYATSYFNKMHFNSQVKSLFNYYIQYHYYAYISDFFFH